MHEMLTRLLAVGDDVDAGILLHLQREQRRVALAFGERLAVEPPRRPQLARLGKPGGFRQTAGDRRFEHWVFALAAVSRQVTIWGGVGCERIVEAESNDDTRRIAPRRRRAPRPAVRDDPATTGRRRTYSRNRRSRRRADLRRRVEPSRAVDPRPHDRDARRAVRGAAAVPSAPLRRRGARSRDAGRRRSSRSACNAASMPASRPARRRLPSPARCSPSAALSCRYAASDAASLDELSARGGRLLQELHGTRSYEGYASPDNPVTGALYPLAIRYGSARSGTGRVSIGGARAVRGRGVHCAAPRGLRSKFGQSALNAGSPDRDIER